MLYLQPIASRFGTELLAELGSGEWDELHIAVAWVRASGMAHLSEALKLFLAGGKLVRFVVGVDLDNTTEEGLASLLDVAKSGQASITVYHNEAGTIFHPKLYLFVSNKTAKLIVGSNNITEAGLYRNTEVALSITAHRDSDEIKGVLDAFTVWTDATTGLAKELDASLLADLVANGYVKSEAVLAATINAKVKTRLANGTKLFGSKSVLAPKVSNSTPNKAPGKKAAPNTTPTTSTSATAFGQVLLMRVRKARGTQVQIPIRVKSQPFFGGASTVTSVSTGVVRGIHPAGGAANPNTLKLELPETATMKDPVVRFDRTATGVQYEAFDRSTAQGRAIMKALTHGLNMNPPTTFLTTPNNPNSATWWRFV